MDKREVAKHLNFFTGYLCNNDQDVIADFVADNFCCDDQSDNG